MHRAAVADAGGLLVQAGLLEGDPIEVGEILVLDATALLVAEYLVLRYEGAPERARTEYGLATRVAAEWFPSRAIAFDAALAAGTGDTADVDAHASLALAASLGVPLLTKNREITSATVTVLHC